MRFRYALLNRPPSIGAIPHGLPFSHEERPAPGQPHHERARHGILVTDRILMSEELRSFELWPLVDGKALTELAERIAEGDMHRYAEQYVAASVREPEMFRGAVLAALSRLESGWSYSVGDEAALLAAVAAALKTPQ